MIVYATRREDASAVLPNTVLGFGKYKFFGPGPLDTDYLKCFFIGQPIPTRAGWYAHQLPKDDPLLS